MSSAIRKGQSDRMRTWMKKQPGSFRSMDVCAALNIIDPGERIRLTNALGEFIQRREIIKIKKQNRRQPEGRISYYTYNHNWRPARKGSKAPKILKAMYISVQFSISDIQRLTGLKRAYIDRLTKRLFDSGRIEHIMLRDLPRGGFESVYHVKDRDNFRIEVMR